MSKSLSARVVSSLLQLWPKLSPEECEKKLSDALKAGEKPTPPPANLVTRHEDSDDGRVFYVNEKSRSPYVVFYIHGGAYFMDFTAAHWLFIERLVKETNAQVVAPGYRRAPFATWKQAFDLITPVYRHCCAACPDRKIILMGDSAGGGLSLALTEHFKAGGLRLPDELILLSPWVDVSMDNPEIPALQPKDPFLSVPSLVATGKRWAGDVDVHDWRVSPIYGDLKGIRHVTVFAGTDGILYPDIVKCFNLLDPDPSNELVVGEGMNHVYPLFPILEALSADSKIYRAVMR